jgi:hypothetical protein
MKKQRKLDKVQLVKELARERIGQVKSGRVERDKRRKRLEEIRDREAQQEIREA